MHRDSPTTRPASAALDHAWRLHPGMPRPIATLFAMDDLARRTADNLARAESEIAVAETMAGYPVLRSFEAEYDMPASTLARLHGRVMRFCATNPHYVAGEEIVYSGLVRFLFRAGYVDGLRDHRLPQDVTPSLPEEGEPDDTTLGISARVSRILGPIYDRGRAYGAAERVLVATHPGIVDAIDAEADALIQREEPASALYRRLEDEMEARTMDDVNLLYGAELARWALAYLRGRVVQLRERLAARELASHGARLSAPGDRPLLAVSRVLAREARANPSPSRLLLDQVEECLMQLAAHGYGPSAVSVLAAHPWEAAYHPLSEVASAHFRSSDIATDNRAVLAMMSRPVVGGRLWPRVRPEPAAPPRLSRRSQALAASSASRRAVVRLLSSEPLRPFDWATARRCADELQPGEPEREAAAARAFALHQVDTDAPVVAITEPALAAALDEASADLSADDILLREVARRVAMRISPRALTALSTAEADRARAHRDVIQSAPVPALETFERWHAQYGREAASAAGSRARTSRAHGFILDHVLDERARTVARAAITRNLKHSHGAPRWSAEPHRRALSDSLQELTLRYASYPRFTARLQRQLPSAAIEYLAAVRSRMDTAVEAS